MRGFSMRLVTPSPEAVKNDLQAIDEIADLGCTWINLSINAYQDNVKSASISKWWTAMPKEADILAIMAKAKSRGMGIMLMPVVLLNNSGSKDWRGVINPPDWNNWFASYNWFITDMAKLAKKGDVDIFLRRLRIAFHGARPRPTGWTRLPRLKRSIPANSLIRPTGTIMNPSRSGTSSITWA